MTRTGRSGADLLLSLAPALVIATGVAFAPQVLNDGDTYWHLAAGEWMLSHGAVLHADPFSYTAAGRPWQTHEWLSEILMAAAFRTAGWSGVQLLFALAAGSAAATMGSELRRWLAPLSQIMVLVLAFAVLSGSLLARPHLLALPLLAIWTVGLLRARGRGDAPSLWLLPLMTLWANLHGGFVIGLGLAGAFAVEAVLADRDRMAALRRWGVFLAGAALAALATPHGIAGFLFPLSIMGMKILPGLVEWRSADFSRFGPFELALIAALYVMLSRGVRISPIRLLVLLGLLHLGLHQVRQQMVLACVGALLLAEPLGRALSAEPAPTRFTFGWRPVALGAGLLAAVLVATRLWLPVVRVDGPTSPISALAHTPASVRAMPVFNDYGMGGYLIFMGVKPFIDGRADMYGDAFVERYFAADADPKRLQQALQGYDVAWTMLDPSSPAVGALDETPGWRRLYADRFAVVHVRAGLNLTADHPPISRRGGPPPGSTVPRAGTRDAAIAARSPAAPGARR